MTARKRGRPKLPEDEKRETISAKLPLKFVRWFREHVTSLQPRTTESAVIELALVQYRQRVEQMGAKS